jgi:hypothetical protein
LDSHILEMAVLQYPLLDCDEDYTPNDYNELFLNPGNLISDSIGPDTVRPWPGPGPCAAAPGSDSDSDWPSAAAETNLRYHNE